MFAISRTIDEDGRPKFDIEIKSVKSHFFGYLINASRTYWRKELEYASRAEVLMKRRLTIRLTSSI